MPIENRDLAAGTRLVVRHKKQEHTCEVVKTKDGLRYRLADGQEFNSPSSAGRAVTGGVAVNGWRFWSLDGDLKPARSEVKAKATKQTKSAKTKKATKKGKARKAHSAKSAGSYGCGVCGQEFPTMKVATKHALTHTAV